MKLISSRTNPLVHHWLRRVRWQKWVVPLSLLLAASWFTGLWIFWLPVALMGVFVAVVAFAAFEYGTTNFALEVWDDGDSLDVVRRGERESIPLRHVAEARYAGRWNPPRGYLYLHTPCRWGSTITFLPDCSGGRALARAMIEDLNARIARVGTPDRE